MISQSSSHQFDHSLSQQPPHSHHRHVSNASSIGSIDSGLGSFDYTHYHHPNPSIHNTFTLPASFGDNLSASAAFGGVPVSADAFHQYPPHHHRSSSTSSSPPFTEPTSISGGNSPEGFSNASNVPGGRKPSQAQMMRRARTHASPYTIRNNSLSWDGVDQSGASSSGQLRSHSVTSEATSTTEDELVELLRTHSRESSLSDWNMASASQPQSSAPNPYQNGLGPAGAFMDPYAAVANVHGHAGAFGPTMVSLGNGASNSIDGLVHTGIVGAPGMVNNSIVGGMGNQMGRMTLDCTETYEALAHHIRTAVTTSAADRARQAFVQAWLNSSYISYTDGNVSRQGLYGSYLRICQEYDIKPINSASFGKAVRQSYPNIKTRRLGVRGNSKYHYCGIRPATAKEAEILMALSRSEQPEPRSGRSQSLVDDEIDSETSPTRRVSAQPGLIDDNQHAFLSLNGDTSQPQTPKTARPSMSSLAMSSSQNGLSDHNPQGGEYPLPFPNLDEALNQAFAQDLDHQVARAFWKIYVEHSHCLLEYVKNNRFDQFELNLRTFWTTLDSSTRECVIHPVMMSMVYRGDAIIYDEILDYLHSQTLNQMPQQAFGSLRQLAQSMEQVIIVALENYPSTFVGPKIELAARFGHLIIRNLGICQLAQALSGVFSNPNSLKDMAEAWDGIDFEAVRNQAALVTNCQHDILGACFEDFRQVLNTPNATLDHFIAFVESTYERCLQPLTDGERGLSPRSLLVRWCFVSSQLIRDLTLRSVSSFGSFQIVNLFFDEWLGFKVLRKVALHVAAVAASVDAGGSCEVNPNSQPEQQLQPGNLFSSVGNLNEPSNIHNFSNETLDASHQPESLSTNPHSSLMPTTVPNYSTSANTGTEQLLFSPDHSQGLVMVHQHTDGGNLTNLPSQQSQTRRNLVGNPTNTESLLSSSSTPLANQQSVTDSSNQTPQSINSQSTTDALSSVSFSGDNSIPLKSEVVYDRTFNELMDVSGFSITMNASSNEPNNINVNLEQTLNSGLNDSVAGSLCTSPKL